MMDDDISECDRRVRESNMAAMRTKGLARWINLKFAAFFSWAGDLGRDIQRDEKRGKDDNYHDEY
jgi:hypothetical protein